MNSQAPLSPPTPRGADDLRASREAVKTAIDFIWTVLRRRGVPERDRHDLLQDILVAALEARPRYDADVATLQKWLNGIILHHIQRWQACCARNPLSTQDDYERQDHEQNPEDAAMMRELANQLYQEIPPDFRDAFLAHEFEGMSLEDIAASRGIPLSTAHYRVKEGRRCFDAALARWKAKHRDRGVLLLPLTAKALLDADRTIPNAPAEVLEAAWRKLQQALGRSAPDGGTSNDGDGPAPTQKDAPPAVDAAPVHQPPEAAPRSIVGPVVVALVAGLIVGAWLDSVFRARREPIAREDAPIVSAAPPVASMAIVPAPSAVASVTPPAPPPTAGPSASAARVDSAEFLAEQAMYDTARAAFTQGDMAGAIQALEQLARRYPRGQTAAERDQMWIDALIRLGRTAEACQRAERFRRAYPKSEYIERLEQLCPVKQ